MRLVSQIPPTERDQRLLRPKDVVISFIRHRQFASEFRGLWWHIFYVQTTFLADNEVVVVVDKKYTNR